MSRPHLHVTTGRDTGPITLLSWTADGTLTGTWTPPAGLAPTPGVAGYVRIRRRDERVSWLIAGASWTRANVLFQQQIPTGFRTGDTEFILPIIVGLTPTDVATLRRRTWGFYIDGASGRASHAMYATAFDYPVTESFPTL